MHDNYFAPWRMPPDGGRLVIGGADREKGMRWLSRQGMDEPEGDRKSVV